MTDIPPFKTPILSTYLKAIQAKARPARVPNLPLQRVQVLNIAAELSDEGSSDEGGGSLDLELGGWSRRGNIKTRRQRIVENISFETECFNIYDPYFTSEEERY